MYQIKTTDRYYKELILATLLGALVIAVGFWFNPVSTLILWVMG